MKNKKTLYFLLPLVLLIWTIIIYKLYQSSKTKISLNSEEKYKNINTKQKNQVDTFSIFANYRDPFLGSRIEDSQESSIEFKPSPNPVKEVIKSSYHWPNIVFTGLIKGPQKQLIMLKVDGEDHIFQQGDYFKGIQIKRIFKDSIELNYQNEKAVIKKN